MAPACVCACFVQEEEACVRASFVFCCRLFVAITSLSFVVCFRHSLCGRVFSLREKLEEREEKCETEENLYVKVVCAVVKEKEVKKDRK